MELAERKQYLNQFAFVTHNTDVLMGIAAMSILMVMVIPIPAMLLDLFLSFNITLALIILLVGMYILKPLDLSSFPSLLLLATLFRLSLNVASTRIILLHGNEGTQAAGKVIMAFGNFVVGGNYLVGVIVFLVLVVINFMVITKGAGRIAEVAARNDHPIRHFPIELLDDLDPDGLLTFDPQAVHRVRQVDAVALGHLLHDLHAAIEIGVEGQHQCVVGDRLDQLHERHQLLPFATEDARAYLPS